MSDDFQAWLKYPVVFLTAVAVSLVLTSLWKRCAPLLGMMDIPDERRIHRQPVPRGGGIAVFAAFHAACAAIFLLPWNAFAGQLTQAWWLRLTASTGCALVLGLLDDRFTLRPGVKLGGQILAALAGYGLGLRMGNALGMDLPLGLDVPATVLWFLVFMNAFNLIDGMDGLAAGLAVVAAVGVGASLLFRHQPGDVLVMLALAGAALGFLRHNFHPASVFLGDAGSLFLGYALAALALGTSSKGTAMAGIGVTVLAAGVPVLDTGLAIWRRSARALFRPNAGGAGRGWGVAAGDAEHLHHRLISRGLSQQSVAAILYTFGGVLAAVGVISAARGESALGVLVIAFMIGTYIVIRHLAWIEVWDSGLAVLQEVNHPSWRSRAMLAYPVVDIALLAGSFALAIALAAPLGWVWSVKRAWFDAAPYAVGFPFIMLVLSRAYSRVWSLARVSEYAFAGCAVAAGIVLSLGVRLVIGGQPVRYHVVEALLHMGLAAPAVVGTRAFPRMVQDMMSTLSRFGAGRAPARRVLLVGPGTECVLYLRERSAADEEPGRATIAGLVVDDPALRGRWVHGYRVLGSLDELAAVLDGGRVDQVVVAGRLPQAALRGVAGAAAARGIPCRQWTTAMRTLDE